jgi:hypothetical protein
VRIALALVLVVAACGDGKKKPVDMPDSGMEPAIDAMVDAPGQEVTFTSYVIDMIANGTSGMTQPRPYSEFATLPDVDLMNPAAYSTLF